MNRRTALKAAVATLALPSIALPVFPRTPDGDSWDNWAAGIADWERDALLPLLRHDWRTTLDRGWILEAEADYRTNGEGPWWYAGPWSDQVTTFLMLSPGCQAWWELPDAVAWFDHVGIEVIGAGTTPCSRVGCCFAWHPVEELRGAATKWRMARP